KNWVLVMVDDGIGFEFHGVWSLEQLMTSGQGPRVMNERVESLRGNLMIESTPTGARIEISIPNHSKWMSPFQKRLRHDELNAILLGASGIVRKYAASETLFKSIRAVIAGEIWIKREVIDDLIQMMPGRDSSATNPLVHFGLTAREMEIVQAVVHGLGNKEISEKLGISPFTVKHYMTRIFDKLLVSNRVELALFAVRQGLAKNARQVQLHVVPKA